MFHRKRFKLAAVVILTLLLTVALAPVAAAQDAGDQGPPPSGVDPDTPVTTPAPDGTDNGGLPPTNGNGGPPPTNGNGGTTDPPGDGMGDVDEMMGAPASWPSPNAIVHHAATPIQISALGGGLRVYYVGPDSVSTGELLPTLSALAEMHPDGDAVSLVDSVHPGTGKHVSIHYLPAEKKIHVSTFYADIPPHDYDKPYIFTVAADHSVTHEAW